MDPDNSFGHWIDSQLAISLKKAAQIGARALVARWRLLGVLCRRRVHDKARAVAVHANRAPSTEVARHRVPRRYTARAAGCCRAPPRIMEFRGRGQRVHTPPHPTRSTVRGTEWHRGLRATPSVNLCIEWRPVLQIYRAPPGAALCCAASHADQRRSNADLRWSAARAQPADF